VGAWGLGPFENDDALDFVSQLESAGVPALRAALEEVTSLDPGVYLEAPQASSAIAAAEVIVALKGGPALGLPPELVDWLRTVPPQDESLGPLAMQAVDRIGANSELKEFWAESPQASDWQAYMADLQQRLG